MYEGEDIEDEQDQFDAEVMAELEQEQERDRQFSIYRAEKQDESDLEPHQRQGYAENMAEIADMKRKESRENGCS